MSVRVMPAARAVKKYVVLKKKFKAKEDWNMGFIAVKFGGSSLADAAQIKKASAIIRSDPDRRYVVVSAPGKRDDSDMKVTDLLYRCHSLASQGVDFSDPLEKIKGRFEEIVRGLGIDFDLESEFETIREGLSTSPERDYCASRYCPIFKGYRSCVRYKLCSVFLLDRSCNSKNVSQSFNAIRKSCYKINFSCRNTCKSVRKS